jgi:Flp pilus assembly pilin Flp
MHDQPGNPTTVGSTPRAVAEAGQGLAEYALILALIAVLAIGATLHLGGAISSTLSITGSTIGGVVAGQQGGPPPSPTTPPSAYATKKKCVAAGYQWVTKPKPAHCV